MVNWNSKINPFGNYDEPIPSAGKWLDKPEWIRYLLWYFWRNPLHNFMHHWIGFRDRQHLTNYTGNIWNDKSKWNIVLPFISYRQGSFECYIGWRPDTKAFGAAWRRHKCV